MNTNTIPKNYTEYGVRIYTNMVDESGEYATAEVHHGTDYTHTREIFINALKHFPNSYCVELFVTTADDDDDYEQIIVEQCKKMKAVPVVEESEEEEHCKRCGNSPDKLYEGYKLAPPRNGMCRICECVLEDQEDEKHRREYPDHGRCDECDCCIDCGCCECEKEESEDGDWDGDLEDTPNCHECGEDCGRTIVTHHKYKNTYFCSQKCQRIYDGDQDNFTHRQCEYRECNNGFDLADPHYYDEDQGVCYCCEECYKNDNAV